MAIGNGALRSFIASLPKGATLWVLRIRLLDRSFGPRAAPCAMLAHAQRTALPPAPALEQSADAVRVSSHRDEIPENQSASPPGRPSSKIDPAGLVEVSRCPDARRTNPLPECAPASMAVTTPTCVSKSLDANQCALSLRGRLELSGGASRRGTNHSIIDSCNCAVHGVLSLSL
jgi:hypothetical protein